MSKIMDIIKTLYQNRFIEQKWCVRGWTTCLANTNARHWEFNYDELLPLVESNAEHFRLLMEVLDSEQELLEMKMESQEKGEKFGYYEISRKEDEKIRLLARLIEELIEPFSSSIEDSIARMVDEGLLGILFDEFIDSFPVTDLSMDIYKDGNKRITTIKLNRIYISTARALFSKLPHKTNEFFQKYILEYAEYKGINRLDIKAVDDLYKISELRGILFNSSDKLITASIPNELQCLAAIALNYSQLKQIGGFSRSPITNTVSHSQESSTLMAMVLFRLIEDNKDNSIELSLLDRLNKLLEEDTRFITDCLMWLLVLNMPRCLNIIIYHAIGNIQIVLSIEDLMNKTSIPFLAERVHGFLIAVQGNNEIDTESAIAWLSDTNRRWLPWPIDGPQATWLGNVKLEHAIRDSARCVVQKMTITHNDSEEILTGRILQELQNSLISVSKSWFHGSSSPILQVDYSSLTKQMENTLGADIAFVVNAGYGRIHLSRIHFIQIKKAHYGKRGEPSWRIDLNQLNGLLYTEQSATYWLLCENPYFQIFCVPAGLLRGLTAQKGTQTATVSWLDIRSAAIDLGNHLCDLLIGLWIGIERSKEIDNSLGLDYKGVYSSQNEFDDMRISKIDLPKHVLAITLGNWG